MLRKCFLFLCATAFACTDFLVEAEDGTFVNGRSLEFAEVTAALIQIFPSNQKLISLAPNQKRGLSWTSKYGYLGIDAFGMQSSFDGMNEMGLSFGYLWMPGFTKYPEPQNNEQILDFVDFCDWVLGNFATVKEVKEALHNVCIWGHSIPGLGMAPVHAAIHDANGESLVVEFVEGKMQVYDNPISILTNSPPFPWQMTNLENYLNLSPSNPEAVTFRGVKIEMPGQGGGFLGMPGDWTPPSRFVKTFTLLRYAKSVATGLDAVNLAEHLLNAVDIPRGDVRASKEGDSGDYTQWVVIKDMTEKVFYFRSYDDLTMKKIDMKRLNFKTSKKNSLPINMKRGCFDVTGSLIGVKEAMTVVLE